MTKTEFKQIVKPLIKETIQEVLLEEGYISRIVSETLKGSQKFLSESRTAAEEKPRAVVSLATKELIKESVQSKEEVRKKLKEKIMGNSSSFDPFKGTKPLAEGLAPDSNNIQGMTIDPSDPGINI